MVGNNLDFVKNNRIEDRGELIAYTIPDDVEEAVEEYNRNPLAKQIMEIELGRVEAHMDVSMNSRFALKGYFWEYGGHVVEVPKDVLGVE